MIDPAEADGVVGLDVPVVESTVVVGVVDVVDVVDVVVEVTSVIVDVVVAVVVDVVIWFSHRSPK